MRENNYNDVIIIIIITNINYKHYNFILTFKKYLLDYEINFNYKKNY